MLVRGGGRLLVIGEGGREGGRGCQCVRLRDLYYQWEREDIREDVS